MGDEIEMTKSGLTIHWALFAKWGWKIFQILLALLLGGHIVMTKATQDRQDQRLDKIDKAIDKCLQGRGE